MTIEEVLGMPADDIEKITPQQWEEFITPYLKVTRPELAEKPVAHKSRSSSSQDYQQKAKRNKAQGILASLGIDLDI